MRGGFEGGVEKGVVWESDGEFGGVSTLFRFGVILTLYPKFDLVWPPKFVFPLIGFCSQPDEFH